MIPRLRPWLGFLELLTAMKPQNTDAAVLEFEAAFAHMADQRHAIAFPYGRTALLCLLQALGIKHGSVITPAWTCVVVPHAIVHSGNEPLFVDCAPDDYNMDLRTALDEVREDTAALVATSIFGHPVNLDALDVFRAVHPHIPVIQDCAHSFLCSYKGRPVHKEGVAAIFGLNISKIMTSIFGGMVTTDDDALAARLRTTRQQTIRSAPWHRAWQRRVYLAASMLALCPPVYGLVNALEHNGMLNRFVKYFDAGRIDLPSDWNVGMTAPEARVGVVQCRKYKHIVERRRRNARLYAEALQDTPDITLPPHCQGATWSHYTLLHPRRQELLDAARQQGVQLGSLIEYNIPDMPAYRNRPGYRDCPRARQLATQSVNLPVWMDVGEILVRIKPLFFHV